MLRVGNLQQAGLPDFDRNEGAGWRRSVLYRSSTRNLDWIGIHVSRLESDASPHCIEAHGEEELVIVLDGQLQFSLCDGAGQTTANRVEVLSAGDMIFHPSQRHHGQMASGPGAAVYATFKWRSPNRRTGAPTPDDLSLIWRHAPATVNNHAGGLRRTDVFELPTRWLNMLHCHRSFLPAGAGYKAHSDKHDVALVVLEGEFQSAGLIHGPGSVLFHPAGYRHGLNNRSVAPCEYYAIEFHGRSRQARLEGLRHWLLSAVHRASANIRASS